MVQDFDLDDFNMLEIKAKRVLTTLSEFDKGLLAKGELIHKKTGLLPEEIKDSIRNQKQSLIVNLADPLNSRPLYNFCSVEIRFRKSSTREIQVKNLLKKCQEVKEAFENV